MAGIGGFDQHGSLSRGLKSGLMTYGGGQAARYLGGAGFQDPSLSVFTPSGFRGGFSSPIGTETGLGKFFDQRGSNVVDKVTDKISVLDEPTLQGDYTKGGKKIIEESIKKGPSGIMKFIDNNATAILLGSMGIAAATASQEDVQEAMRVSRGTGMDIDKIRAEVQEAFESGEEAWNELKKKYPYIGDFSTKKAEGGIMRSRYYSGGQSIPSEYTVEDARKTAMQDKLGGITDIMKKADLDRQGDIGQMYMAEGGLMDLGGMEKDYRNEGGFVPIGKKEKADDVPARLSVNEFVFTADAVRGAGGGDIDKGAEIMENVMKNLEKGGRISEESQGLQGAREMFEVSERLSEVV